MRYIEGAVSMGLEEAFLTIFEALQNPGALVQGYEMSETIRRRE